MKFLYFLALTLLLATPLRAAETYDLIFRLGTLDDLPLQTVLTYDRQVNIPANPDYAARNTGTVALTVGDTAALDFRQGDQHRALGQFPTDVGNPVIMYFVETVLRDVAQETGGSPFYIRNRIKDALLTTVPVTEAALPFDGAEIATRQITLRPFADDPNRDRLGVYADLALRFTLSDDAPGWYLSLVAEAPGADGQSSYHSSLTLQGAD